MADQISSPSSHPDATSLNPVQMHMPLKPVRVYDATEKEEERE